MGFCLPRVIHAKQILRLVLSTPATTGVPKGHFAIYVGQAEKKRFVIPLSYLNQDSFQELLRWAEEAFGFDHPMGGLTIPCREEIFADLVCNLQYSS